MSSAKKLEFDDSTGQGQKEFVWNNRIIVIEDQKELADSYKQILAPEQKVVSIKSSRSKVQLTDSSELPEEFLFDVTIASNAEDALEEIKKAEKANKPFALGFVDVLLGEGMDGLELVKEIHKIDPDFYAVFVTAYHDRSVDSIHKMLGMNQTTRWDYLTKPFSDGEILQKARNTVCLWNLQKERLHKQEELGELQKQMLEGERFNTVAAVARGVSHEFGNILVQIMGKADLGRRQGSEKMKDSLEKILLASERASEILDSFNNLSNTRKVSKQKEQVFVPQLVDDVLDLMDHQFKTANVKVCKVKNDKVHINANSTSLLQVLVNLSINAMHAMESSGQIDYSVQKFQDKVEIKVRDYGPGISKDKIHKVFDTFFTTKGDKGTGLGLAICKEIIEIEHQGKIELSNHEIKGLEIRITLPLDIRD